MFEVVLSPEARKFHNAADPPLARKLEHDPRRHNNIKRLSGKMSGLFRNRIGDWRVLYRIDDRAQRVNVLVIAHRSAVYE